MSLAVMWAGVAASSLLGLGATACGSCGDVIFAPRDRFRDLLDAEPWNADFNESDCEKPRYQSCPDIYQLASSLLAEHCDDEVVCAARRWLSADNDTLARWASCLLGRCGGGEELDRAVASAVLTEEQRKRAQECEFGGKR